MKKKNHVSLEGIKNLMNEIRELAEVHSIDVPMIWWNTPCRAESEEE